MASVLLPPPPRPRGRGWRRRFFPLLGVGTLLLLLGGWCVAVGVRGYTPVKRALEVFDKGRPAQATVVSKRIAAGGRAPAFYVLLELQGPPHSVAEFTVPGALHAALEKGAPVKAFVAGDGRFLPEFARAGYRPARYVLPISAGAAAILVLAMLLFLGRHEFRLLRRGIELVGTYDGREVAISHEGRTRSIGLKDASVALTVGEKGVLVLADPDLSHVMVALKRDWPARP